MDFETWGSFFVGHSHYIASPADRPHEWELRNQQLAFSPFEGHHSGANMANILIHTVDRYEIRNKV